jgi:hypothetical protein
LLLALPLMAAVEAYFGMDIETSFCYQSLMECCS